MRAKSYLFLCAIYTGEAMFIGRIREYVKKNQSELTMALVAAVIVSVVYIVVNLILWNDASTGYALAYGLAAFAIYFIARRLMKYLVKNKEGVIEKHDNI